MMRESSSFVNMTTAPRKQPHRANCSLRAARERQGRSHLSLPSTVEGGPSSRSSVRRSSDSPEARFARPSERPPPHTRPIRLQADPKAELRRRALRLEDDGGQAHRSPREAPMSEPKPKATSRRPKAPSSTVKDKPVELLQGGNPRIAKADGDAPLQAYIAAMPGWKRDVARRLDALIERSVPDLRKAVFSLERRGGLGEPLGFPHRDATARRRGGARTP